MNMHYTYCPPQKYYATNNIAIPNNSVSASMAMMIAVLKLDGNLNKFNSALNHIQTLHAPGNRCSM